MTQHKQSETIWVFVKVQSGIPAIVEAYREERTAEARQQVFRQRMNPDNDETAVFEVEIGRRAANDE